MKFGLSFLRFYPNIIRNIYKKLNFILFLIYLFFNNDIDAIVLGVGVGPEDHLPDGGEEGAGAEAGRREEARRGDQLPQEN